VKIFEIEILSKLFLNNGLDDQIEILENSNSVIEFSGVGYFLTIKDKRLPIARMVLDSPDIQGNLGEVPVGYLAFVEASELMLECYSYDEEINSSHREKGFVYNAT
jgi:hypothetical protein